MNKDAESVQRNATYREMLFHSVLMVKNHSIVFFHILLGNTFPCLLFNSGINFQIQTCHYWNVVFGSC